MNMLQHGEAVHAAYLRLIAQLDGGEKFIELPPLIQELYGRFKCSLVNTDTIEKYHIWHDCGKPACRVLEAGVQRFPEHAKWSTLQYGLLWPDETLVQRLINMDMEFHTRRGEGLAELWFDSLAPTLYLTAWAEIIANSAMFGGFDSMSFKIKKKALISAGKKF
jgi:hypothetical protein